MSENLETISLVGEIDASKMLRIAELAQDLGLRVVGLAAEAESVISTEEQENSDKEGPSVGRIEFMGYAREHVIPSEPGKYTERTALGSAMRTYVGLMTVDSDTIKSHLGVEPPKFKDIATKKGKYVRSGAEMTMRKAVDTKKTSGLDGHQAARYLVALSDALKEIDPTDEFNSTYASSAAARLRPSSDSWIGLVTLMEFLITKGHIPEDVSGAAAEGARVHFRSIFEKNASKVNLRSFISV